MRFGTLRLRVVLAAAGAIALAVAALGGTVALLIAHQLHSSLDSSLNSRAQDLVRLALSAPSLLTAPGALDAPAGGRQVSVEVVDRRGRIVARSDALGGRLLPGGALLQAALQKGAQGYTDARLSGERIRLDAVPIPNGAGPEAGGAVLVSASTEEVRNTLSKLGTLIALSTLAAAVLGAMLAALLVARGMRPLRRLSEAAGTIARTGDAARRLPDPETRDELAELARALNTMLGALERSQQTERRFLADASHELRTPLTSLRGNLGYLRQRGFDPEVLADVEADAERLGRLVDDLLSLEREGGAQAPDQAVWLPEVVRDAAERGDARLTAADPVAVRGDPLALERAVANLIDNAHVHGPAGGDVAVELRARDGRAVISVTDQGPGLAPGDREHAFDRFWRGPAAAGRPGTGLGLALVRAIAERHGGRVSAQGSRFTIDLPAVSKPSTGSTTVGDVDSEVRTAQDAHPDTHGGPDPGARASGAADTTSPAGRSAHSHTTGPAGRPPHFTTLTGKDSGGEKA
ncbi:MAG TPA: HAMP domain-containing sensor histidine kinase [Solirubrobacteraceae bacterium]|nr:HAMP domain-containing sensor histidine kinase [Solirubrobacteraceae bacterium]